MKTVQTAFREANKKDLIYNYLYMHPVSLDDVDEEQTVAEAKEHVRTQLSKYIDRLRNLPIKMSDEPGLFYVHKMIGENTDGLDIRCELTTFKELHEKGIKADDFAYDFTPQEEVMGYLIADNELTQDNLDDLLVNIMFECSFFGIEQEDLQEHLDALDESRKEVENGKGSRAMSIDEFEKELGIKPDHKSAEEEKLERTIYEAEGDYIDYSRNKELQQIIDDLS